MTDHQQIVARLDVIGDLLSNAYRSRLAGEINRMLNNGDPTMPPRATKKTAAIAPLPYQLEYDNIDKRELIMFNGKAISLDGVVDMLNAPFALKKGEIYAGILLVDGKPDHHVILLAGDTSLTWDKAVAWAKKQGGELPTRKEQALLFANAAAAFQSRWYWSSEQHASNESYAWMQDFDDGGQTYDHKDDGYRARAVRRVPIQ